MKLRFGFQRLPSLPKAKFASLYKTHGKEATIVVAAWNSKNRARADYLAPKEDALDYITEFIIPKLPSNGGSITLLEGNFEVTSDHKPLKILSKSKIKLQGQGKGTILDIGTGGSSNLIEVEDSNAILIENLYINGESSCQPEDDELLKQHGILFNDVSNSKISNVWMNSCKKSSLCLYNSHRNEISGANCLVNDEYGILIKSSNYNAVVGNTVNENVFQGILLLESSVGNSITGNACQGNEVDGIKLITGSDNNAVTGNTCINNSKRGIYAQTVERCTITGNTCSNNGWSGILARFRAKKISISSNICSGNGGEGIKINDGCEYCTLMGNGVQENGKHGILLDDKCDHNSILNNGITDNGKAAGAGTVAYDGLIVSNDSNRNNLQGNTVRKVGVTQTHRYGINIADIDCDDNFVTNNDLKDAGVTADLNDNGTGTITTAGNRT